MDKTPVIDKISTTPAHYGPEITLQTPNTNSQS